MNILYKPVPECLRNIKTKIKINQGAAKVFYRDGPACSVHCTLESFFLLASDRLKLKFKGTVHPENDPFRFLLERLLQLDVKTSLSSERAAKAIRNARKINQEELAVRLCNRLRRHVSLPWRLLASHDHSACCFAWKLFYSFVACA